MWATMLLAATSWPDPHVPAVAHGDKLVHVALYAVLAWLAARADGLARPPRLGWIVAAVCTFAALDEWHQQFIPGRSMSTGDWVADSIGGAAGLLAVALLRRGG